MKQKKNILALIFFISVLSFSQCKKCDKNYDAYFWAKGDSTTLLTLYVNGGNKGTLRILGSQPACKQSDLLYVPLSCGKHSIEAKDQSGNLKSASELNLKRNGIGTSTSGGMGGLSVFGGNNDNCLVVEIIY